MSIYLLILRNWLMWLWRWVSPQSAGWASMLKAQRKVSAVAQV